MILDLFIEESERRFKVNVVFDTISLQVRGVCWVEYFMNGNYKGVKTYILCSFPFDFAMVNHRQ